MSVIGLDKAESGGCKGVDRVLAFSLTVSGALSLGVEFRLGYRVWMAPPVGREGGARVLC